MLIKPIRLVIATTCIGVAVALVGPVRVGAVSINPASAHQTVSGAPKVLLEGSRKKVVFDPNTMTISAYSLSQCEAGATNLEVRNDTPKEQRILWLMKKMKLGKSIIASKGTAPLCFSTAGRYKFDLKSNTTAHLILTVTASGP